MRADLSGAQHTPAFAPSPHFGAFAIMAVIANGTAALNLTPLTALGDAQGQVQGVLTRISGSARYSAPPLIATTLASAKSKGSINYLPGAPFAVLMISTVIGALVFLPGLSVNLSVTTLGGRFWPSARARYREAQDGQQKRAGKKRSP